MLNDSVKDQVREKLKELGAFVDDELPDYIMVMVANKKSKEMMIEDLQLFLSSDTEKFCNWLHDDLLKSKGRKKSGDKKKKSSNSGRIEEKTRSRSPHNNFNKDILSVSFNSENEFDKEDAREQEAESRKLIVYKDIEDTSPDYPKSSIKVVNKPESSHHLRRPRHHDFSSKIFEKAVAEAQTSIHEKRGSVKSRIGHRSERRSSKNNNTNQMESDARDEETPIQTGTKRTRPDIKSRLGPKVVPSQDLMDTDGDNNFVQAKRIQLSSPVMTDKEDISSSNHLPENLERCRFWPNCNKPEECNFIHPTEQCKAFPNCKNSASTCLYIHPKCKYDGECTRPDCIYLHSKPKIATLATPMSCKFFPNCTNLACPYIHPIIPKQQILAKSTAGIPCRYGSQCRNRPLCYYDHRNMGSNSHSLKWVNPNIAKKSDMETNTTQGNSNSSSSVQLTA